MQSTIPRQAKLLGATIKGLGVVTAVSAHPGSVYALIKDADGHEHHRFVSSLKRHEVVFAPPQPFKRTTRRVGYGVWDELLEAAMAGEDVFADRL